MITHVELIHFVCTYIHIYTDCSLSCERLLLSHCQAVSLPISNFPIQNSAKHPHGALRRVSCRGVLEWTRPCE